MSTIASPYYCDPFILHLISSWVFPSLISYILFNIGTKKFHGLFRYSVWYFIFVQVSALCNNSYSVEELKELPCWVTLKAQIPNNTGTSFTNIIYTKSATFPSWKIPQSRA
jgi:hypothetical protein